MASHFTRTIRDEQGKAVRSVPCEAVAATNRAAWPTGPLPLFGVVSDILCGSANPRRIGDPGPTDTANPA